MANLPPQPNGIIIEPSQKEDLAALVDVHIRTNSDAYLTHLGSDFLSAMYECFISDRRGISFVAKDGSSAALAGVAIGCVEVQSFYRKMGLHMLYPYVRRVLSAWLHGQPLGAGLSRRYTNQAAILPKRDMAYIAQLNVVPDYRGRNIGGLLVDRFCSEARQKGVKRVFVIANEDNLSARKVYENSGFVLKKSFTTPADIKRCLYEKDLSEAALAHLHCEVCPDMTHCNSQGREQLRSVRK